MEDTRVHDILERFGLSSSQKWWESGWDDQEKWREKCKRDLYFLSTVVLGCSRFSTDPMEGPLGENGLSCNEELCLMLTEGDWDGKNRLMVIQPRDAHKTTTLHNYLIQRILQNPSVTILLEGATLKDQVLPALTDIKHQFENNDILRALFPEIRPMKGAWTGKEITVSRKYHRKEPTIRGTAVGLQPEGGHYDIICPDDLVTNDNCMTRDKQQKVITWFTQLAPLLNPEGIIVGAGTRYGDYDLYGWMQRETRDLWHFITRAACYDDDGFPSLDLDTGHLLFPQKLTRSYLRAKKLEMGVQDFSSQYLNDPVPSALAEIKEEWIEASWANPPDDLEMTVYGAMDPATGTGQDSSAVAAVGIDSTATLWIRDVRGGKWQTRENVDQFLELLKEWDPMHSVFEAIGVGAPLEQLIVEKMEQLGLFFSVEFVKSWDKNLENMARTVMIPRFQAGKVKIAPHLKNSPLFDQILRFPKAQHDDWLAAVTMAAWTAAQFGHMDMKNEGETAPAEEENAPREPIEPGVEIEEDFRTELTW
jgi:hypothetical protein